MTGGSIWRMSVKRTGAIGWRGACDYHLCTMSYAERKQVLLLAVHVRFCVCPTKKTEKITGHKLISLGRNGW